AVALLPVLTLALQAAALPLFPRFWQMVTRHLCRPLPLVVLAGSFFGVSEIGRACLFDDYPSDYARNPHLLLARSCFGSMVHFGDLREEGPADLDDFLPGQPRHAAVTIENRPINIIVIGLESNSADYRQQYHAHHAT